MSEPIDDSLLHWAAASFAAILLGLLAWLARTVFGNVTKAVEGVGQRNDKSNKEQLDKLEKIAEKVNESASENRTARAITELRLGHLETGLADARRVIDDHTGFLQGQGFKKRDG